MTHMKPRSTNKTSGFRVLLDIYHNCYIATSSASGGLSSDHHDVAGRVLFSFLFYVCTNNFKLPVPYLHLLPTSRSLSACQTPMREAASRLRVLRK